MNIFIFGVCWVNTSSQELCEKKYYISNTYKKIRITQKYIVDSNEKEQLDPDMYTPAFVLETASSSDEYTLTKRDVMV